MLAAINIHSLPALDLRAPTMILRNWHHHFLVSGAWLMLLAPTASLIADDAKAIEAALLRAGENMAQLQRALAQVPAEHQVAMRFLVANMPAADLKTLSAEFLLENVR